MKRVWKPLDVGGKRLYAVTLQYFTQEGKRAYGNYEPPQLVLGNSPRHAASLMYRIYSQPDNPIRVECFGKAVNVLMPESWWEEGIPS